MFDYVVFLAKRAALQLLCNFIPLKAWRIRARNAVYAKYLGEKVVLLGEVNSHLPAAVLAKINAYENEYFVAQNAEISVNLSNKNAKFAPNLNNQNAQILANAHTTNERERERERVRAA